jgi:hypothetical protein
LFIYIYLYFIARRTEREENIYPILKVGGGGYQF